MNLLATSAGYVYWIELTLSCLASLKKGMVRAELQPINNSFHPTCFDPTLPVLRLLTWLA